MKYLLAAGAALLVTAVQAHAQTTPSTTNGIPNTTLSTSTQPSTGPRSREGDLPSNNAAAAMGGGMQAPPTVQVDANGAPMPRSPSANEAFPAPAPMAHYPMCSAGQFDECMEPGNGGGTRSATIHRGRAHRRR